MAVQIEHFFLDELWNYGSQQINISDQIKKVLIKNADGSAPLKIEEEEEKEVNSEEIKDQIQGKEGEGEKNIENIENNKEINKENLKEEEKEINKEMSPAEMDNLIFRNFLMCIIRHITDSQLPMEPSKLQGDYMYKYEHTTDGRIDFKKSNYKKITKFLKKMKQQKLIEFSKPKGKDHEIIVGIKRKSN